MANSTGEMTFDLGAQQTYRFTSEPLDPKPEYQFKLLGEKSAVKKKEEPGKFPYVEIPIEVLGTAKKEGDRNRVLFHRLFCSLKPDRNGKIMVARQDQAAGLAQAAGQTSVPVPMVNLPTGEVNETTGEAVTQRCLNPQALQQWVKGMDGKIVKGKVKTKPAKDGYPASSEIDFFIPAIQSQSGNGSPDPFAEDDKKKSKK